VIALPSPYHAYAARPLLAGDCMTQELIGRSLLWSSALTDAAACLDLADTLSRAPLSSAIQAEEIAFNAYFVARTGRELDPHIAFAEDAAIAAGFERELPSTSECHSAADHLRKLAIVYFCQMYTQGYAAPGSVAKNLETEASQLRGKVEARAFQTPEELQAWVSLRNVLIEIRNQQLGHADGPRFNVQHGHGGVSATIDGAPHELCLELRAALTKLQPAISACVGELLQLAAGQAGGLAFYASEG